MTGKKTANLIPRFFYKGLRKMLSKPIKQVVLSVIRTANRSIQFMILENQWTRNTLNEHVRKGGLILLCL